MKLRFTLPAQLELDETLAYVAAQSPRGAAKVQARIKSVISIIIDNPRIGLATSDPTIRRMLATPFPYAIFYEPRNDEIIIHSIRHTSRKLRQQ